MAILHVSVEVRERHLEDTALEVVVGVPDTLCPVHQRLANIALLEKGRGLDVVPVLAGKGVNDLLLDSLLSLRQPLVCKLSPVSQIFQ